MPSLLPKTPSFWEFPEEMSKIHFRTAHLKESG